jgi:putative DNA primase/helicase
MGRISDSERLLLTALISDPSLLEKTPDLCVNAFSRAEHRKIFATIAEIWEDKKPESICELELAGSAKITIEELQSITNGCSRITRERFVTLASDLVSSKKPKSIRLSEVEPEPVNWLWPNYFPISKINLISGDPGAGKTWFCLDLAARLSRGRKWPDGSHGSIKGNSLILSCEDGAADTFRPRLNILKADPSKIFLLQNPLDLSSETGRTAFISEIEYRKPNLIIIDPILDFSGRVNPNAVEKVRAMLTPLAEIAERTKAALILTSHLNKSSVMQAIYRTAGSASGWVGKARAVFLVVKDKEGQEENEQFRRIFAPIKSNLSAKEPKALFFHISDNPGLTYEPVPGDFNLEERLAVDHREDAPQLEEAKIFLKVTLKAGPVAAACLLRQAKEAGIAEKTFQRAKRLLGILTYREGGSNGRWIWALPQ